MKCSFKYIFIIFIIIYCLFCWNIIPNESFKNFTISDIQFNPELAGSIPIQTNVDDSNELLLDTYSSDQEYKKEKIKYQQLQQPVNPSEYRILPKEFQVPQVKYVTNRQVYYLSPPVDYSMKYNNDKIPLVSPDKLKDPANDCYGEWDPWDESNCEDSKERCSLKTRIFNVINPKKKGGQPCRYKGKIIKDGDFIYDYCYGSSSKDRCGSSRNLCPCNVEKSSNCSPEVDKICNCPPSMKISRETGKCEQKEGNKWIDDFTNEMLLIQHLIDHPETEISPDDLDEDEY